LGFESRGNPTRQISFLVNLRPEGNGFPPPPLEAGPSCCRKVFWWLTKRYTFLVPPLSRASPLLSHFYPNDSFCRAFHPNGRSSLTLPVQWTSLRALDFRSFYSWSSREDLALAMRAISCRPTCSALFDHSSRRGCLIVPLDKQPPGASSSFEEDSSSLEVMLTFPSHSLRYFSSFPAPFSFFFLVLVSQSRISFLHAPSTKKARHNLGSFFLIPGCCSIPGNVHLQQLACDSKISPSYKSRLPRFLTTLF